MSEQLPEFETDAELIEWFESADLSKFSLDEVLRVAAEHVTLTVEQEGWSGTGDGSSGATVEVSEDELQLVETG